MQNLFRWFLSCGLLFPEEEDICRFLDRWVPVDNVGWVVHEVQRPYESTLSVACRKRACLRYFSHWAENLVDRG